MPPAACGLPTSQALMLELVHRWVSVDRYASSRGPASKGSRIDLTQDLDTRVVLLRQYIRNLVIVRRFGVIQFETTYLKG